MIRSMTGFGRGEAAEGEKKFSVEMKAVNHRYFDVNIRMPKNIFFLEAQIRSELKRSISRGKLDLYINFEDHSRQSYSLCYNSALAHSYAQQYKMMADELGLEYDLRASSLGRCPEVFTLEEIRDDDQTLWPLLEKAIRQACAMFVEAREKEGEALKKDILAKLEEMTDDVRKIEERYPAIISEYTQRIKDKAAEVLGDAQIDESRLAAEIVLFSDKLCTDEETVRLMSHIRSMQQALSDGGEVGRKLDFIAQEMNREANTIASKANDMETSQTAIDLKTRIEKIREQIQNLE